MKRIAFLCVLVLLGSSHATGWEFSKSFSFGYSKDDNISLDTIERWYTKDWYAETGLALLLGKEVARGKRWSFTLDYKNRDYREVPMYDLYSWGIMVSYRQKDGLGMMAPWWRLSARYGQTKYPDTDIHDRGVADLKFELGKRIKPKMTIWGDLAYENIKGLKGDVYDGEGLSAGFRCQYELAPKWLLSAGFKNRRGDVVVHAWEKKFSYYPRVVLGDYGTWGGQKKVHLSLPETRTNRWNFGLTFATTKNSSWNLIFEKSEMDKNNLLFSNEVWNLLYILNF